MSEALKEKPSTDIFANKAKLNKQLAIFHQQVKQPKENGHVNYKATHYDYVLLQDLIAAIDDGLQNTGLTWTQQMKSDEHTISIQTVIKSDSGYEEEGGWLTFPTSGKPQDVGSALTYAKRYSLGTAFGINSETDDDGSLANNSNSRPSNNSQTQSAPAPSDNAISSKQVGMIKVIASRISKMLADTNEPKNEAEIIHSYLDQIHVKELTDLDKSAGSALIKHITSGEKKLKEKLAAAGQSANSAQTNKDPFEDMED